MFSIRTSPFLRFRRAQDESSGDEFAQVPKKAVVLKGTHLSSLNVNTEASK